jgi:hypothetical protein
VEGCPLFRSIERTSVRTGKALALTHLSRRVDDFGPIRVAARAG